MLSFKFCKQCGQIFYRNKKYCDVQWKRSLFCSRRCSGLVRNVNDDKTICERYLNGESTKHIAKKFKTTGKNVRRILKENNIDVINYRPKGRSTFIKEGYIYFNKSKANGVLAGRPLHDVILEMKLGRAMLKNEVGHHKNKNKLDNHPDNLEVMTRSEHIIHHLKERGSYDKINKKYL